MGPLLFPAAPVEPRRERGTGRSPFDPSGTQSLAPVKGRAAELLGVFTIGDASFGFKIFKNGAGEGSITYNPATGTLKADFSRLNRLVNDRGVYDGIYTCTLPEFQKRGTDLKLNIFIDHSIVDIFINDRWATSIRVFPTDTDADGIEAFSTNGSTAVKQLNAWTLDSKGQSGIDAVTSDSADPDAPATVYDLSGRLLRSNLPLSEATAGLPAGLYIVNGRKTAVR